MTFDWMHALLWVGLAASLVWNAIQRARAHRLIALAHKHAYERAGAEARWLECQQKHLERLGREADARAAQRRGAPDA